MAHQFIILDIYGKYHTYTEYDDIPKDKILEVIKCGMASSSESKVSCSNRS